MDHQDTHVNIYEWENGDYGYYILRKDNPGGVKKLTKRLIEMYEQANAGHRDRRVEDLEHFEHVCFSLHQILPENEPYLVPECDLNPRRLDCLYCKGFKGVGICSHVLAINHILKEINLRRSLKRRRHHGQVRQHQCLPETATALDTRTCPVLTGISDVS